jgi:hypothetical protein
LDLNKSFRLSRHSQMQRLERLRQASRFGFVLLLAKWMLGSEFAVERQDWLSGAQPLSGRQCSGSPWSRSLAQE